MDDMKFEEDIKEVIKNHLFKDDLLSIKKLELKIAEEQFPEIKIEGQIIGSYSLNKERKDG